MAKVKIRVIIDALFTLNQIMRIYQYILTAFAIAAIPLTAQAYTEYVDSYDDGIYETSSGTYIVSENCYIDAYNSKVTIRGSWMTFKNGKKCYIDEKYDSEVELHVEYFGMDQDEAEENYSY